jgi:hypothetical protein
VSPEPRSPTELLLLQDVADAPVDPPFPDLRPLPQAVTTALVDVDAPARLVAHLRAVHDVATQIVVGVEETWPALDLDREAVLLGAATHDVGKALHPDELIGPGDRHEHVGSQLLLDHGFAPHVARFARTHAAWNAADATIEDLFVALADKVWKGRREVDLEQLLIDRIASETGDERWEVFAQLDEMLAAAASEADGRLAFQNQYPGISPRNSERGPHK